MDVIEGSHAFVEGQSHEGTVGFGQNLHSVDGFKLRKLIRRELSRNVNLTALLSKKTRVFIREEIKLDGLRGSIPTPPGSALLENCLRVGLERGCLVGAGTHNQVLGRTIGLCGLVEGLLSDPQATVCRHGPPEILSRRRKGNGNFPLSGLRGLDTCRPVHGRRRRLFGILRDVDREENIFNGHGVAVLELRVLTDLEYPGFRIIRMVSRRNCRNQLAVFIDSEQTFRGHLCNVVVDNSGFVGSIQGRQRTRETDRNCPCLARGLRRRGILRRTGYQRGTHKDSG